MKRVGNKYLRFEGNAIVINQPYKYAEAYIDEEYYESSRAKQIGNGYEVIGLFNMRFFTATDKSDGGSKLTLFKFPTPIYTIPSSMEKKKLILDKRIGEKNYIIFKYYEQDHIMDNRTIISKFDNTEQFFKVFGDGKYPSCIPYEETLPIMLENMSINQQNNLDSTPLIFSFIIGESLRYKKNKNSPYRMVYDKNPFGWVGQSSRNIAGNSSTFSAITFEDPNQMLQLSIIRDDEDAVESPLEKTILM